MLNRLRSINNKPAIVDLTFGQPHLPINPIVIKELSEFLAQPQCSLQINQVVSISGQIEPIELMNFIDTMLGTKIVLRLILLRV